MAASTLEVTPTATTADAGRGVPSTSTLHLELPARRLPAIEPPEHDGSHPKESHGATEMLEEDAHTVVGVSISRAQTRLMSPQTPAAEKAAAMAEIEGGGLFDGAGDDDQHGQLGIESKSEESDTPASETTQPSTPPDRQHRASLPSPWRAMPKTFEKPESDDQGHQVLGPTSMLSDLNVRRYMSSFSLPSLPKSPSFKDFTVPSLSSILSNTRSRSPLQKNATRQKRASTFDEPGSSWAFGSPFGSRPTFETRPKEVARKEQGDPSAAQEPSHDKFSAETEVKALDTSDSTPRVHQRAASNASIKSPQTLPLRRATSDQSLLLRRVTSTGSSLGDDSRWENVQEQVNSRMKAIKDSLQDSSIKLPSMPNLSNMNLHSFRPDFTRSHAQSEARRPLTDDMNGNACDSTRSINGDLATTSRDIPNSLNVEAFQANGKASKAPQLFLDEALENLTGDLVVLGGYRGSILRSAQPPHRQLWVPVKVGLNIRRVNLEVGLEPEDEENMHDHIFASGMLSHIGPVDMGRRLLKRLRTCKNAQEGTLRVYDYGWDWRLSPHLSSRRLVAFLADLPCNASSVPTNNKGATIIAHSMGGLITRHAVNQRPELFAGVVYAGVPQHCVNILGPMRNGDEVLLSSKVLTAQVNFTLRSSFLLLPDDGKCFINKETKEEYPVDFFDVEQWKEYAWSPCIAPALPAANPLDNKTLLGAVTDMFPSIPSLPMPGRKSSTSRPNDNNSTVYSAATTASTKINDIANPSTTRALDPQFSPSASAPNNPQCTLPLPNALAYLRRTLDATLAFKAEMVYDPLYAAENAYPPLSILYANNTPTVVAARVCSRDAIRRADAYDDLQFASGDGVCLARAAMLPEGYAYAKGGRVRTERGHVGLLGDLEAVGKCLVAVIEGRRQGIGLGVEKRMDGSG